MVRRGSVRGGGEGGRGVRVGWVGGQGGCERRIEIFVKIQKKLGEGVGSGGGGAVGFGGQGGCVRRIEVFVKIQKTEDQWSCKRSPDILAK